MKPEEKPLDRREFLLAGGLVGAGAAVATVAVIKDRAPRPPQDPTGEGTARKLEVLLRVKERPGEDDHLRMQRELVRAMAKPVELRHWIMVIDIRKCIGCQSCTIGCVAENKLPPGVVYRPVTTQEFGCLSEPADRVPSAAVHALRAASLRSGVPCACHLEATGRDCGH